MAALLLAGCSAPAPSGPDAAGGPDAGPAAGADAATPDAGQDCRGSNPAFAIEEGEPHPACAVAPTRTDLVSPQTVDTGERPRRSARR